ncbi:reverse transcriptase, partial [Globisporangium splendens]
MYTATQARKANASIGHVGSTANEQRSRTVLAVSQTVDDWDNYFGVLDEHDEPTCGQQLGHVEKADLSCSNPECSQVVQSSVQHLFWECPKAKLVWNYFYALWAKIGITPGHDPAIWIFSLDLPDTPRHAWTTIKRHIIGHKFSNEHLQDHLYPVAHMLWRYMSASLIQTIWQECETSHDSLKRKLETRTVTQVAAVLKAYVDCFLSQTDAIPLTPSDTRGVYLLFFDGGSRGNPGPGGTGSVIVRVHKDSHTASLIWAASMAYSRKDTTNNFAEYWGLIHGLREAQRSHFEPLECIGPLDSTDWHVYTRQVDDSRIASTSEDDKDASGVTDPLARNETINWPVPRHFRSQRRVILDERVFLNDSKSNVDKMLAVPGVAGRHRADKTVHLALQLEDIAKRYECLQSVDEKTMSDVPIDDDACMQLDTHSALKMSTLKITISGLRSSSSPRKRLAKFLNTILITGRSRK